MLPTIKPANSIYGRIKEIQVWQPIQFVGDLGLSAWARRSGSMLEAVLFLQPSMQGTVGVFMAHIYSATPLKLEDKLGFQEGYLLGSS